MQTALALRQPAASGWRLRVGRAGRPLILDLPWLPTVAPIVDDETKATMSAIAEAARNPNTDRAHEQDLTYIKGWAEIVRGELWALPIPVGTVLAFIAWHLAPDPITDARLVAQGVKAKVGPHSLATIKRRLASLSVAHRGQSENPTRHPSVRDLLAQSARALASKGITQRQADAATLDVIDRLLRTCGTDLRGIRDRAILLVGVSAGGRRRSELSALDMADLKPVESGYILTVRRSKTDQLGEGLDVPVLGRAGAALAVWLEAAGITEGRVFCGLRNGRMAAALSGAAISRMVMKRARQAGVEGQFSAHSLRSGFVSQAARGGVGLLDTMALSGHRSMDVARKYYRAGSVLLNPAAGVFG